VHSVQVTVKMSSIHIEIVSLENILAITSVN
jgi:hypothetical protein